MGACNISFLSFRVIFHFHDYARNDTDNFHIITQDFLLILRLQKGQVIFSHLEICFDPNS